MVPWCIFSYFETLAQEQSLQAIQEILDTYEVSWVAPRGVLGLKKRSTKISMVWENDWKSFLMVVANIYSLYSINHVYIYIHIFVAGKQGWRPLLLLKVYDSVFFRMLVYCQFKKGTGLYTSCLEIVQPPTNLTLYQSRSTWKVRHFYVSKNDICARGNGQFGGSEGF